MEQTQIAAKQKEEELNQKLEVAINEAKTESKEKERQAILITEKNLIEQIKLKEALSVRVEELEWYFLSPEQQSKNRDFSTPALLLMKKRKQEMLQELEDIRKKHAKKNDSAGNCTLETKITQN